MTGDYIFEKSIFASLDERQKTIQVDSFENGVRIFEESKMIEVLGHFILQDKTPFSDGEPYHEIDFLRYKVQLGFSLNSLHTIEKVIHYILLY